MPVMAQDQRLLQYLDRYNALKAELQTIGFISQGSVQTRQFACGNSGCRCHRDPKDRHGPYHYYAEAGGQDRRAAIARI